MLSHALILATGSQTWPSWPRTPRGSKRRIVARRKVGVADEETANTLEVSTSTLARAVQQRFNSFHSVQASLKAELSPCESCQHCCRCWKGGSSVCRCSDLMSQKMMMQKTACKHCAEDKQTDKGRGWVNHDPLVAALCMAPWLQLEA